MGETGANALSTSLLLARLGRVAMTPPSEQQLLDRLHAATQDAGCCSRDLPTAIYVGLKLHMQVCVFGSARDHTVALLTRIAATMVGSETQQVLHVHAPIGSDAMAQRFAAVRLGEFISSAIDPSEQSKAWFVVVDAPGDPATTLRWITREIAATQRANGSSSQHHPPNVFVLVAAGARPDQVDRGWLPLAAPQWSDVPPRTETLPVSPVGYQRLLLHWQFRGSSYRQRLQRFGTHLKFVGRASVQRDRSLLLRWCAAGLDEHGCSLWHTGTWAEHVRSAVTALVTLGAVQAGALALCEQPRPS